jgi:hydrogenase maturation protease
MNPALVDRIVAAVLYEGYILYPYRASSKKNRQRFTFGRVYPEVYSVAQKGMEPWVIQTECLVRGAVPQVDICVRFLQPQWREILVDGVIVPETTVAGKLLQTWQEAVERDVALPRWAFHAPAPMPPHDFAFAASETPEAVDSDCVSIRRRTEAIAGAVEIAGESLRPDLWKLTVRILNRTPMAPSAVEDQDAVLMRTFTSTHTILSVEGGEFVSLLDPPAEVAAAVATCANIGTWPVLVGDEASHERDALLSSPIILYDYPQLAPESPGDLCDGTEIDEILTLRIMTMTDAEKAEMRQVDEHARRILERTEALPREHLMRLHGALREIRPFDGDFFNPPNRLTGASVDGVFLQAGDQVRIRPKKRADAMDMILAGKTATIEAVEQDVEGAVHFALVLADDPGADIGFARMPGHRFFYGSDEVEPLEKEN